MPVKEMDGSKFLAEAVSHRVSCWKSAVWVLSTGAPSYVAVSPRHIERTGSRATFGLDDEGGTSTPHSPSSSCCQVVAGWPLASNALMEPGGLTLSLAMYS